MLYFSLESLHSLSKPWSRSSHPSRDHSTLGLWFRNLESLTFPEILQVRNGPKSTSLTSPYSPYLDSELFLSLISTYQSSKVEVTHRERQRNLDSSLFSHCCKGGSPRETALLTPGMEGGPRGRQWWGEGILPCPLPVPQDLERSYGACRESGGMLSDSSLSLQPTLGSSPFLTRANA